MSAKLNGRDLVNGLGWEGIGGAQSRVEVFWEHPVDRIEPQDPPRATGTHALALRYLSGHDPRTLQEIGDANGVSKQRLNFLVCRIADKLGIPTAAPGRRRKSPAHPKADEAVVFNSKGGVNGSKAGGRTE